MSVFTSSLVQASLIGTLLFTFSCPQLPANGMYVLIQQQTLDLFLVYSCFLLLYLTHRDVPLPGSISASQHMGFVTVETSDEKLQRASSLENFRKHMDLTLNSSSRKSVKSVDSFSGSLRKAKSDSDVTLQTYKKKVEVR